MNKKVASLESQMDARVNMAVQQALSQRTIGAPQAPDVVISPADQQHNSCASTAASMYKLSNSRLRHQQQSNRGTQSMISPFQQHARSMCE